MIGEATILFFALLAPAGLEPDEAVEAGREALARGWISPNHPWYDAEADDLEFIAPPPPPAPQSNWNWSWPWDWPDWNWTFDLFGATYTINLLLLAVILLAVFGLVWILMRVYRGRDDTPQAGELAEEEDIAGQLERMEALPFDVKPRRRGLLETARELYERGAYAEAILYLYSYQLVELDKSHRIHLAKGKTNRQYLRELGRRGPLRKLVERSMSLFEDSFFGHHAIDRQDFEAVWRRMDEFHRLTREAQA